MKYLINDRTPEKLFRFFEEISVIPRGSGNESEIADYICDFARSRGLEYLRDEKNNVFVKKAASAGYEDRAPVLLQGHLDMVCVKKDGAEHDFMHDPLKLCMADGYLSASGTTLGADDGAGVSVMLALLDDGELAHPPIECLFTAGEEIGMVGALAFDASHITSTRMLNLDGDDEGVAVIGCAGGADVEVRFGHDPLDLFGRCITVSVSGFAGGHSGLDIHKERINAVVLLSRILASLYDVMPFNLVSMHGGSVCNAIPNGAEAVIAVSDEKAATAFIEERFAALRAEFTKSDRGGRLRVRRSKTAETEGRKMLAFKSVSNLLSFITLAPSGVIRRNKKDLTFVEASANLASVRMADGETKIVFLDRATTDEMQKFTTEKITRLARLCGGEARVLGSYPGWVPVQDSELRALYLSLYEELFPNAEKPQAYPLHIGLECGIIAGNVKRVGGVTLDCIAIGPQIYDIHTPKERMDIASFERFYSLVTEILKRM